MLPDEGHSELSVFLPGNYEDEKAVGNSSQDVKFDIVKLQNGSHWKA